MISEKKTKIDFIRLSLNCGKIIVEGKKKQLKERNKVTEEKDNNGFIFFYKRKEKKKRSIKKGFSISSL